MKKRNFGVMAQGLVPGMVLLAACALKAVTLWAADLSSVRVYPNPWMSDRYVSRVVTLDNLPQNSTIKIYTVYGQHLKTIPSASNMVSWDLANESGEPVTSGVYFYRITTEDGQKTRVMIAVVK